MPLLELPLTSVLQKTPAGLQEIASRKLGLQARERSLLILMNGQMPLAKLLAMQTDHDLAHSLIQDLLDKGLVEVSANSATGQPVQRPDTLSHEQFEKLKLHASHCLEDVLGLDAQRLCLLIEQCKTKDDFDARLEKTINIVSQMKTPAQAAAYQERVLFP